jgi:hypothetical protein
MWKKTKVMRISRHPSPVTITIDQKQLENVKYFKYLVSILTENGRCTCEIKSRLPWQKLHLTRRKFFFQQTGIKFEEETSEMLRLEHGSVWCWNLDAPGNSSETPGKL